VGIFIVAVSLAVVNGPIMAMLQAAVDAELQGRVFSLVGSLTGLASPFGLLLAGPLAEITAVQTWFLLGGIISALISIAGFFIPALLDIETGRTAASRSAPDPVPEV
jgi:DHA3 family macrolide efflux protein-like MFS transporter